MRLSSSLGPIASAVACSSSAVSNTYDFGNLPPENILYGAGSSSNTPLAPISVLKRQTASCTHGPTSRSCWSSGYSVNTDFDQQWPNTGNTRNYNWVLTNGPCNPSGQGSRDCMLINGQYPGPLLEADWGDTVHIVIQNNLQNNGTSIHWHGVRQLNSNGQDGTNGLTECPLAPGQAQTYTFAATQYGTSWYHSHHSVQYGDGIVGPIVVNGPASANYDVDLGPFSLSDWYYRTTAFQQNSLQNTALQSSGPGPAPDTILINGTNGIHSGKYLTTAFTPGKLHRLRLINLGVDNAIRVSIDQHQMQVIAADWVPIKPVMTDSVVLAVGQRYDVIVNASRPTGNYWMRALAEKGCNSTNLDAGGAQSIIRYSGAAQSNPTTSSTATSSGCNDPGALTPIVAHTPGSSSDFKAQAKSLQVSLEVPGVTTNNQNIVTWGINMTGMDVAWSDPTLQYVLTGNTSYPVTNNLIALPNEGIWTYWIIQEVAGGAPAIFHPIHLHGHDFYILGSGVGTFNTQTDPQRLSFNNPTRRDTAMLPAGGWLVLAFETNNPGAWLMHCHIAWHISQGLGVQFLEAPQQINVPSSFSNQCVTWNNYYRTAQYKQEGSGLR